MSSLWPRMVVAALLAAALLWAVRAQGRLAADVRAQAHHWLSASIGIGAARQPPVAAKQQTTTAPATAAPTPPSSLPWPLYGVVRDGARGLQIAAPGGALVHAIAAGRVLAVTQTSPGYAVTVDGNGLSVTYRHLGPSYVRVGAAVQQGELLGELTHFAPNQQAHLTVKVSEQGKSVDPLTLLGAP